MRSFSGLAEHIDWSQAVKFFQPNRSHSDHDYIITLTGIGYYLEHQLNENKKNISSSVIFAVATSVIGQVFAHTPVVYPSINKCYR